MMVSLGEEEELPRHEEHQGLFVSALTILTFDHTGWVGGVSGRGGGRARTGAGMSGEPAPRPAPLSCMGAPHAPEADRKIERL